MREQRSLVQFLRHAQTAFFPSAVFATFLLWLLFLWHSRLAGPLPKEISGFFNIPALRFKLFESGPIPYAISWTFLFGLTYLFQIWWKKLAPLFIVSISDKEVLDAVYSGDYERLWQVLDRQAKEGSLGYYGNRLYNLVERFSRDQDLSAVTALKNDILDIDEEDFALSFVAITWCETALPLLGFLGTVVGIGGAIGEIQKGVQQILQSGPQAAGVLEQFGQGFRNMGVAFDTTFQGLAGLIIIGIIHIFFKKRLAVRLARARDIFSEVISRLTSVGTSPIVVSLVNLEARMQAAEEVIRSGDMRSTLFRETVLTMAMRVIIEDPSLQSVKKVLLKPWVEFEEIGKELAEKTNKQVTEKLGYGWEFISLGLSLSASGSGVAVVRKGNDSNHLLFFEIDGESEEQLVPTNRRFSKLFTLNANRSLLALTESGELGLITKNPFSYQGIKVMKAEEDVLQVTWDKRELALIILKQGDFVEVNWMDINLGGQLKDLGRLPHDFKWSVWSVHAPSATLFAAGKSFKGTRWQLYLVPIRQSPVKKERGEAQDQKEQEQTQKLELDTKREGRMDLPSDLVPKQIIPVANDEVLILDSAGNLHYWDTTRPSPLKLSHQSWVVDPRCTIRAGAGGWIAVAAEERLNMWRVFRGGFLYKYEHPGFNITAVDNLDTLKATSDGRYLLAIGAHQNIIAWKFPKYVVDEL